MQIGWPQNRPRTEGLQTKTLFGRRRLPDNGKTVENPFLAIAATYTDNHRLKTTRIPTMEYASRKGRCHLRLSGLGLLGTLETGLRELLCKARPVSVLPASLKSPGLGASGAKTGRGRYR